MVWVNLFTLTWQAWTQIMQRTVIVQVPSESSFMSWSSISATASQQICSLFWQEHFSSPFHPDGDWWCYDILLMTWHSKIDILQLPGHYWCPSPVLLCSAIYDQSVANTHHSQARFLQVLWFPRHLHNMRGLESGLCFRLGCCEFSRDSSTKLHTSIRVSKVIWLCCVECSVKVYTFNITSIEVLNEEKWI